MESLSIPDQDGGQQPGAQNAVSVSGPRVPVPRGDRARDRMLRAALEVLAEGGLPGFTVEAVAERAGASKATIYRHWRLRGELIVDAMDMTFQRLEPPRSGQLRSDLIELVSDVEALFSGQPFPRLSAVHLSPAFPPEYGTAVVNHVLAALGVTR